MCFGVLSSLSTPATSTGRPPPDHEQKMRDADRQLEMILQGGVLWPQRSDDGLSPCLSQGVKARMPSLNSVESETAPISSYFWNQVFRIIFVLLLISIQEVRVSAKFLVIPGIRCESSDVAGCLNRCLMWRLWSSDLVLRRTSLANDSGVSGYFRRRCDLVIRFASLVSSCSRYQSVTGPPPLQSGISGSLENRRRICLSGNSNLPKFYFFSFVIYISIAIDWIYILYNERMFVFGIHIFTLAVFILKAPNLLCETEDKPYGKKTGMRDVLFMIQYEALVRKISVGEVKLGLAGTLWLQFLFSAGVFESQNEELYCRVIGRSLSSSFPVSVFDFGKFAATVEGCAALGKLLESQNCIRYIFSADSTFRGEDNVDNYGVVSDERVLERLNNLLWLFEQFLACRPTGAAENNRSLKMKYADSSAFPQISGKSKFEETKRDEMKLVLALFATIALVSMFAFHHGNGRKLFCGFAASIFSIIMYASPLAVMRRVIKPKSVKYMLFFLSLFVFLCGTSWFVYGLLGNDLFLTVPNGIGCALGAMQLILYALYRKKEMGKTEKSGGVDQDVDDSDTDEDGLESGLKKEEETEKEQIWF